MEGVGESREVGGRRYAVGGSGFLLEEFVNFHCRTDMSMLDARRCSPPGVASTQFVRQRYRLPPTAYAIARIRRETSTPTSTTAHTLRTDAAMKAEYAARPMRSQMLRPMVSAAATVIPRHTGGMVSR